MDIKSKIFKGLKDACYTSFFMKNGDFTDIKPEYLLTSLIARELAEKDSELVLKLEEPTEEFATSCVKQVNENWLFSKNHNVCRNGKIDIAVYKSRTAVGYINRLKSLFPIEIKGVNPLKCNYLEDVERNIQYFEIHDKVTGGSILNLAYNVSIYMHQRFIYQEELPDILKLVKKKYKAWLSGFEDVLKNNNLEVKIYVKDVMSKLHSQSDKFDLSEGDTEWSYMDDWHIYIGVVVEIKRKEII